MAENDAVRIGLRRFLFWYLAQPYSVLSVHINAQPRAPKSLFTERAWSTGNILDFDGVTGDLGVIWEPSPS